MSYEILKCRFLVFTNITFQKCTCLGWCCSTLAYQHLAKMMPTRHDRCVQDFANVAFHWATSISTCKLVLSNTSATWLMLRAICQYRLPKDWCFSVLSMHEGLQQCQPIDAPTPQLIHAILGLRCLLLINVYWLMCVGREQCHWVDAHTS